MLCRALYVMCNLVEVCEDKICIVYDGFWFWNINWLRRTAFAAVVVKAWFAGDEGFVVFTGVANEFLRVVEEAEWIGVGEW